MGIRGAVLEKIVQYLMYKWKYASANDIPEFPIGEALALDLLVAADFLDC